MVREALTHLAGEGLLSIQPNRGFFIPDLTVDELTWITELRCHTEELAVSLALQRGDLAWESDLMAAHHRLARTPMRTESGAGLTLDWLDAHREFHATLIQACGVEKICEIAASLNDSTMLYRRWAAEPKALSTTRDVEREHQEILEAALARDVTLTSSLLRSHYEATLEHIVETEVGHEASEDPK